MKIIGYNKMINKIRNLFLKIKLKITGKSQVFYINGSESLPPPLSREEESDIMRRLSEGDNCLVAHLFHSHTKTNCCCSLTLTCLSWVNGGDKYEFTVFLVF